MQKGHKTFPMQEHTDAQLVALACADDPQAFQLLIERYQLMAFYLALRSIGEEETARELVQEALLQAYLSLNHLRDPNRFKSWFYGIVLNLCRSWQRLHTNTTISLDASPTSFTQILQNRFSVDPQELIEGHELQEEVRAAMNILTPKNQAVTYLFYFEDRSIQEIAEKLNISLTAVKNRLHKGRQQLHTHLQTLYPNIIAERRRKKNMLHLKLVKELRRGKGFSHSTTLILLDERKQRVWLPQITEWREPDQTKSYLAPQREATSASTIHFLRDIIHALKGKIEKVEIDTLYDDLLYARVHVNGQRGRHTIKAHTNDALRLVLHEQCPIAVADTILDKQAISLIEYGETQQQRLEAIEHIAQHNQHILQPHTQKAYNLDFSDGLRDWTLFASRHDSHYTLDAQETHTNKASLALTVQQEGMPNSVLLAYKKFPADRFRGKRLRARAYLKAEGMQQPIFSLGISCPSIHDTDKPNQQEQRSTNTELLHIINAQAWTTHELVIDVPNNAQMISLSFQMRGKGKGTFWLDGIQLEIVDKSTPQTSIYIDPPPQQPVNLDFSHGLEFWTIRSDTSWQYACDIERGSSPYAISIKSTTATPGSSYTLQQMILAEAYWGKHIRLSALIKTASVEPQASLFIGQFISVNKTEETIKSTAEWARHELTLSVPEGALALVFGVTLQGTGQVWLKGVEFQVI